MEHLRANPHFNLKTYKPEEKFEVGQEAVPVLNRLGMLVFKLGGFLQVVIYSLAIGFLSIFHAKDKIMEYQRKKEKVVDLRKFTRPRG